MNKTLLLILCDFLLLTLLSLVNWEEEDKRSESSEPDPGPQSVSAMAMMEQDLLDTLTSALEEEKRVQETLQDETDARQEALEAADSKLKERDASIVSLEAGLEAEKKRVENLTVEKAAVLEEATKAKESIVVMQSDYEQLEAKAKQTEAQARMLQEELDEKLRLITEKETALAKEIEERKNAESRAQELDVRVKVTEEQKRMLEENVESLKSVVVAERAERQQLQQQTTQMAEGITQLAERSQDLTEEFRSSQPVNANTLFDRFNQNKILARFDSNRFYRGQRLEDDDQSMTVLVSDGRETVALVHASSTPFGAGKATIGFRGVDMRLSRAGATLSPPKMEFLTVDPRISAIPLTSDEAAELGGEVFYTTVTPFKFSEAVLIDEKGEYYGEVEFKLDANTPGYVKMQSRVFSRIFGDFSPSKGDLVLSKTGELLGLMVDSRYCVLVPHLLRNESLAVGTAFDGEQFKSVMVSLKNRYQSLSEELR